MGLFQLLREAGYRIGLLLWVVSITLIAIVPLLILAVVFVIVDIALMVFSAILPSVEMLNIRLIFGKEDGPGAYIIRWFKWISANMNVLVSGIPASGKWTPPLIP